MTSAQCVCSSNYLPHQCVPESHFVPCCPSKGGSQICPAPSFPPGLDPSPAPDEYGGYDDYGGYGFLDGYGKGGGYGDYGGEGGEEPPPCCSGPSSTTFSSVSSTPPNQSTINRIPPTELRHPTGEPSCAAPLEFCSVSFPADVTLQARHVATH